MTEPIILIPRRGRPRKNVDAKEYEKRRRAHERFLQGHKHRCVRCRSPYMCQKDCDPVGEGLKSSICMPCFREV